MRPPLNSDVGLTGEHLVKWVDVHRDFDRDGPSETSMSWMSALRAGSGFGILEHERYRVVYRIDGATAVLPDDIEAIFRIGQRRARA
ncbi:MAG TPA: hypothetical protein VIM69_00415 [Opitutaceae bacterium]